MACKQDYLLPLTLRVAGKSVHDLPAERELRRCLKNPRRLSVALDPVQVKANAQRLQSSTERGRADRRRLVLAGCRKWRHDTGEVIPCNTVAAWIDLAVSWHGGRRDPRRDSRLIKHVVQMRKAFPPH